MLTIPYKFTKKDALNKGFKASFICIQQYFFDNFTVLFQP
jgi:hypothetical protein